MNASEESIKKIAKGAGIIFLGTFLSKFLTYLFKVITARLGVENYGILVLAIAVTGAVSVLMTLGLDHGIYRFAAYYREKNQPGKVKGTIVYSLLLLTGLSLLVVLFFFGFSDWIVARFFPNIEPEKLSLMLKVISISIPFLTISKMLNSFFRSLQKPQYEVYTKNLTEPIVKLGLVVVLFLLGFGIMEMAVSYIIAIAVSCLIGLILVRKLLADVIGKVKALQVMKELLPYSVPLLSVAIFFTILTSMDMLMVGYFKTASDVGIYNAASATAQLTYAVSYAILTLFLPVLMGLYVNGKNDEVKSVYQTTTKWILIVNSLLFGLLALYSREFLSIMFGKSFAPGSIVLAILVFGYAFSFTLYSAQNMLLLLKKSRMVSFNITLISLLIIGLNYLLIPLYGLKGAAFATSASLCIWGVMLVSESYYFFKVLPFRKNDIKVPLALGFCIILFYWLKQVYPVSGLVSLLVSFSAFGLAYLGILIMTKTFKSEELALIKSFKNKLLARK